MNGTNLAKRLEMTYYGIKLLSLKHRMMLVFITRKSSLVIDIFCIPQLIVFGVTLIREFIVKQTRSTTLPHRR